MLNYSRTLHASHIRWADSLSWRYHDSATSIIIYSKMSHLKCDTEDTRRWNNSKNQEKSEFRIHISVYLLYNGIGPVVMIDHDNHQARNFTLYYWLHLNVAYREWLVSPDNVPLRTESLLPCVNMSSEFVPTQASNWFIFNEFSKRTAECNTLPKHINWWSRL